MSKIVAQNVSPVRDCVPLYDRRQTVEMSSPTFAQLLNNVRDVTGDETETPVHQVLTMQPQNSIPFVLSFSNLTYSVRVRRKVAFPAVYGGRAEEAPVTTTKVLLHDISGETRDGELLAVLGASGSGKSTLIDALAN
ncbi:hypothetical protein RDI58_010052 [Solanum bulbocastanum]|uniref:ABC transporter domain-containing protein n=1 Tax=Solanum bulbocastanum TaxID=147425 RepID=A0AAN8TVQ6_SOLBU